MPDEDPLDGPPNAGQLARYLFGNPLDPRDQGIIGRMDHEIAQARADWQAAMQEQRDTWQTEAQSVRKLVGRMLNLGWAILLVLLTVTGSLIGNLYVAGRHP